MSKYRSVRAFNFTKLHLRLFLLFGVIFSPVVFSETHQDNKSPSNPNLHPSSTSAASTTDPSSQKVIKDGTGAVIGTLDGHKIISPEGEQLGEAVLGANGEITLTMWNIDQLKNLPEGSPLRKQYDALKEEVARLKRDADEQFKQLEERISAADQGARSTSDEMKKITDRALTAAAAYYTGTLKGLQATFDTYEREGRSLRTLREGQKQNQEKIEKLMKEGDLSKVHALLLGREKEFSEAMGNVTRETIRDLKVSNQDLAKAIKSADKWESGLQTTRNVAVVGGAVIATGGLASVGFVAAAVGGTAAGTTVGALSNYTEASQQVALGNMSTKEAWEKAHQQTVRDVITSAQIAIAGGTAGLVSRTVQGSLGVARAATVGGRLITGASAGGAAGAIGSALGTATNLASGTETRTSTQIAVDTLTQTVTGALGGTIGAATQLRLDQLAARSGGVLSQVQSVGSKFVGEVLAPSLISGVGTYGANILTGRAAPTRQELLENAALDIVGAVGAGASSSYPIKQRVGAKTLPKTEAERFGVTAEVVQKYLPSASSETVQKIQKLVENEGHFNESGVVTHGEATPEQLRARTEAVRHGLETLGVNHEVAKKITSDVIRGGAAGNARRNDFTEDYRRGELEDREKPKRTTHKNAEGGQSDLDVVKGIGKEEGLTVEQLRKLGEKIHEIKEAPDSDGLKKSNGDLQKEAIRELARSIRDKRDFDPRNVQTKESRQLAKKELKRQKREEREEREKKGEQVADEEANEHDLSSLKPGRPETLRTTTSVDVVKSARTVTELKSVKTAPPETTQARSPQSDFKIVAEGPLENRTYSMINISTGETVQQMKGANIRSGALNSGEIGDYKGTLSPPPERAKMFYEAIQKDFEQQGLIQPTTLRSTYVDSNGRAFTKAYEKYLKAGLPRDEAAKRAVLETPSGAAAQKAFGVEPYDVEIKPAFDRAGKPTDWVEVEFRVPRAQNSGTGDLRSGAGAQKLIGRKSDATAPVPTDLNQPRISELRSSGVSYAPPKPVGGTADYPEYRNYNDAMKAALAWASERGTVGSLETGWGVGKLVAKHIGSNLRNQYRAQGPNGESIQVRIERHPIVGLESKPLNHINISYGKENGPHFIFPGNEADLNAVLKQLAPVLK